jgi:glutamate formiminotransferase/formiminotetrahydrofolate cyclodeaminase
VPEKELIHTAVLSLGLDEVAPFDSADKIIEYRYRGGGGLVDMKVTEFSDELSSDSPAPGGGSVAALCGALSASLSAMVASLTWSKKGMEDVRPGMKEIGYTGQELKNWFLAAVDRDTDAFNAVLAAGRLPKSTDEEKAARLEAIEKANQNATMVPLEVLERSVECLELAKKVAGEGNPNSVSDAGVAGACALAAAEGAALNVRINLPSVTDEKVAAEMSKRQQELLQTARRQAGEVLEVVNRVLG